ANMVKQIKHPKIGFLSYLRYHQGLPLPKVDNTTYPFDIIATDDFKGEYPLKFNSSILELPAESTLMTITAPSGTKTKMFFGYICLFDDINENNKVEYAMKYENGNEVFEGDSLMGISPIYYLVYIEDASFLAERNAYAAAHHNSQDQWKGLTGGYNIVRTTNVPNNWDGSYIPSEEGGEYMTMFRGLERISSIDSVFIPLLHDTINHYNVNELDEYFFLHKNIRSGINSDYQYFSLNSNYDTLYIKGRFAAPRFTILNLPNISSSTSFSLDLNIAGIVDLGYFGCMRDMRFEFENRTDWWNLQSDTLDLNYLSSECTRCYARVVQEDSVSIQVGLPINRTIAIRYLKE
ncbi:MAG: hypothetical protein WCT39_07095, partial [Candidatus Margulisiibacteriota bacterium]